MKQIVAKVFAIAILAVGCCMVLSHPTKLYALPNCASMHTYYSDASLTTVVGVNEVTCSGVQRWGTTSHYYRFETTGGCTWDDCPGTGGPCCDQGGFICKDGLLTSGWGEDADLVGTSCPDAG